MIPEKGKTYNIEFTDPEMPSYTHYVGPGVFTGKTDVDITGETYEMFLPYEGESGLFGEKSIIREIAATSNPHDGSTLDSFLLEEANNKINKLGELLYETIEYIRSEKVLRNAWEGSNARLDQEADKLIENILNEVPGLRDRI